MKNIIFLHGLLGTAADWKNTIENLPHFRCIALDLPLHGQAKHIRVNNFADTCNYLANQIQHQIGNADYWLVGYSLGGRIALYAALQSYLGSNLQGLILEGVNFGLKTESEKQRRWQNDNDWARRFEAEPAEIVLNDWYQQPVFAHLQETQRQQLIQKRAPNTGENIAKMLRATSLANQPDFSLKVRSIAHKIHYFCGEQDSKFHHLATQLQLNLTLISQSGHNAHSENPQEFSQKLTALLTREI